MTLLRRLIFRLVVGAIVAIGSTGEVVRAQNGAAGAFEVENLLELKQTLIRSQHQYAQPSRLEMALADRLDELQVMYELSEAQRKKLELAGRGEVKSFTDQFDSALRKLADAGSADATQELVVELNELRQSQKRLFADGSRFSKVLARTLSQEQVTRNERLVRNPGFLRYRKAVTVAVRTLAGLVNMGRTERLELSRLILTETTPPHKFGRSDYAFVMFQISRLPETRLKEIIPETHWSTFKWQITPWAGSEAFLKNDGFVFDDARAETQPDRVPLVVRPGESKVGKVDRSLSPEALR
jgi:hypothetical protein